VRQFLGSARQLLDLCQQDPLAASALVYTDQYLKGCYDWAGYIARDNPQLQTELDQVRTAADVQARRYLRLQTDLEDWEQHYQQNRREQDRQAHQQALRNPHCPPAVRQATDSTQQLTEALDRVRNGPGLLPEPRELQELTELQQQSAQDLELAIAQGYSDQILHPLRQWLTAKFSSPHPSSLNTKQIPKITKLADLSAQQQAAARRQFIQQWAADVQLATQPDTDVSRRQPTPSQQNRRPSATPPPA